MYKPYDSSLVQSRVVDLANMSRAEKAPRQAPAVRSEKIDLAKAAIELRPVERQQLYVDGKPIGTPIE